MNNYLWIGPILIQWGRQTIGADPTITFPIPFPNACTNVNCTPHDDGGYIGGVTTQGLSFVIGAVSATSFTILKRYFNFSGGGSVASQGCYWQAVGY